MDVEGCERWTRLVDREGGVRSSLATASRREVKRPSSVSVIRGEEDSVVEEEGAMVAEMDERW